MQKMKKKLASRYNHYKEENGDRPRQDKSDDKQPKWLPKRDQDKRSETRRSGELQVPWIISNEGSKPEILSRIVQTTVAFSRLKIIWMDKNISLASKVKLMRTLILSTCLWELSLDSRNRKKDPSSWDEMLLETSEHSYKDHVTNEEARNRMQYECMTIS